MALFPIIRKRCLIKVVESLLSKRSRGKKTRKRTYRPPRPRRIIIRIIFHLCLRIFSNGDKMGLKVNIDIPMKAKAH